MAENRLSPEPPTSPAKRATTEAEIRAFIVRGLADTPQAGYTNLLRKLRRSGMSCEQSRFRSIYLEYAGQPRF